MSAINKSYLEELPIELVHRIFDHLDAETIVFSMRCVNKWFYSISNTYNRYELDFRYMSKSDLSILARIIDPKNIISVTLADELQTSGQIELFLSQFPIDQFIRLRSLNLINIKTQELQAFQRHIMKYPLKVFSVSPGNYFRYYNYKDLDLTLLSSIISHNNLLRFEFDGDLNPENEIQWPLQCRLEYVTISSCDWNTVYCVLNHLSYLRTLVLKKVCIKRYNIINIDSSIRPSSHLTSLSINDCSGLRMDEIQLLLSLLPMLKCLRLFSEDPSDHQFFDGSRWEELIQSKLPLLDKFQFSFSDSRNFDSTIVTTESLIAPFQTPFWLENKNWRIKCDFESDKYSEMFRIYSIPIFRDHFEYPNFQNKILYSTLNVTENNATIVVNAHKLSVNVDEMITHDISQKTNSTLNYLFLDVTELQLKINRTWSVDVVDQLSNIVNLSSLQTLELNVDFGCKIVNVDAALEILLKRASNLRSIRIRDHAWTSSRLMRNSIFLKLPRHIKHLDTNIENVDDAKMILERIEHLSSIRFEVYELHAYEFQKHIKEWFTQKERDVTTQIELTHCGGCGSRCGRYQSSFPIHVWLSKSMNNESDASMNHKRMKRTDPNH